MMRSLQVKGITGSGKSSGSGAFVMENIVRHPRSSMFIIGQKPEERGEVIELFKRHKKPLITIEEGRGRCNILEVFSKAGADTQEMVEFFMTISETLNGRRAAGENDAFFRPLQERMLFSAIEIVKQGTGTLKADDLLKFFSTAAYAGADLADPAWQAKPHNQMVKRAYQAKKNVIQDDDFTLAHDFFTNEFVHMDDRPRSSGLAGVMNVLHTFATGKVKWQCASDTEVTPAAMDDGVSFFLNFPFTRYGPTGKFIAGAWKYAVQKHILRSTWDHRYFKVLWMDEFQSCATSFDPRFLEQCRSHGGCMVCLTQTINSDYMHMSKPEAAQLLANFGTHIFHLSDIDTAKFASDLLGLQREIFVTINPSQPKSPVDGMFGNGASGSYSESYQPILQPGYFMSDLLCGGPPHNLVDGIVIQLGQRNRYGANWQRVSFKQGK